MNNPILAAFITEFQEKKYKISDYKMNSNQSQCLIWGLRALALNQKIEYSFQYM